jgi:oligopeptide transport system ATP-binding protein
MLPPLLAVEDLHVLFRTPAGVVHAVNGVSFELAQGEALGLVGESGCGKSVTALSIVRLLPMPPAEITRGSVRFNGEELLTAPQSRMRQIRGGEIAMVFQDPMTSLNPVMTVGSQIAEALLLHRTRSRKEAWALAVEALERVHIPDAAHRARDYPHTFSGGMRQRVMLAMAVASRPRLLIADEPTTALDVTLQAEILELLQELRREYELSIVLITHDLAVVSQFCDTVAVMYAGKIVEWAPAEMLFGSPMHPYTVGLLESLPEAAFRRGGMGKGSRRMSSIPGAPPDSTRIPPGCAFHPRCRHVMEVCRSSEPPAFRTAPKRWVRCWLYAPESEG